MADFAIAAGFCGDQSLEQSSFPARGARPGRNNNVSTKKQENVLSLPGEKFFREKALN
jgi:hypothetical protein